MACENNKTPQESAKELLSAYFDCRYADIESKVSPQMLNQMRFRASNLTQSEVELMAQTESSIEFVGTEENGDTCVVTIIADNVLLLDSLNNPGHIGRARYCLTMSKKDRKTWQGTKVQFVEEIKE